jgi:hypothetical protein
MPLFIADEMKTWRRCIGSGSEGVVRNFLQSQVEMAAMEMAAALCADGSQDMRRDSVAALGDEDLKSGSCPAEATGNNTGVLCGAVQRAQGASELLSLWRSSTGWRHAVEPPTPPDDGDVPVCANEGHADCTTGCGLDVAYTRTDGSAAEELRPGLVERPGYSPMRILDDSEWERWFAQELGKAYDD